MVVCIDLYIQIICPLSSFRLKGILNLTYLIQITITKLKKTKQLPNSFTTTPLEIGHINHIKNNI